METCKKKSIFLGANCTFSQSPSSALSHNACSLRPRLFNDQNIRDFWVVVYSMMSFMTLIIRVWPIWNTEEKKLLSESEWVFLIGNMSSGSYESLEYLPWAKILFKGTLAWDFRHSFFFIKSKLLVPWSGS